jgi:uncharacterized protein YbaP (TraB family)
MYTCYPVRHGRHKIIYVISLLAVIWLSVSSVHAYEGRNAEAQRHFIWAVESGRNTVYLLGSIHIMKQDSYPLPREVEKIFECCKKIVFETDLDGMNDPESQKRIMKQGLYSSGRTLPENISQETYALIKKRADAAGLPVSRFERFRPWFAAITLTGMELQRLGFDPALGLDRYFYQKAKKEGKEMIFLETNDIQLNLMASLNKRHQDAFLRGVLKELDIIETLASDILDAWNTGDAEKLDSILKMSHAEEPAIYDRFFIQRNKRWISKIQRLMKQDDDVLIIVGAGHLVGRDSVIELLKKKGYEVQQR